ncbi:hypothetical protein FRUB_08055 [Fimbriiglobus ruber]|uniref:Uncharacterized protein n=1 Tax=Fimbriiglobus ruber TaxID=1908690 RepID=A0A225D1U3_9BACT|nr:hypothetical protein FRUB_08055 [Fimbriiglobus ruber]
MTLKGSVKKFKVEIEYTQLSRPVEINVYAGDAEQAIEIAQAMFRDNHFESSVITSAKIKS